MDMYKRYKSALGYELGDDGIDSYGVDHNGFSTRDEVVYQFARDKREGKLLDYYQSQGINDNYPQFSTDFWGNDAADNYGFGSSNIEESVKATMDRLNKINYTIASDDTINPAGAMENNNLVGIDSQPQRTVYQSLSGFAPDNQRWYENNLQKDSFNYIQDNYETNPLVNDCLKSDRFRKLMNYLYQPEVEGRGYEDNPNKIDQPTLSGLSENFYNDIRKKIPEIANNYPNALEKLTPEQVENIMCQGIYKPQHVETINNDKFAKTYWDLVVNHNPNKTSIPWIQKSVNEIMGQNVKVDGVMGTSSIIAVNSMNEDQLRLLNNSINEKRRQYFEKQNSPRFRRGLLKRNKRLKW